VIDFTPPGWKKMLVRLGVTDGWVQDVIAEFWRIVD
jgi:hypothetical protein